MIASQESFEPKSDQPLPKSQRVYLPGKTRDDIRVPMREVELSDTKGFNGEIEVNEPVRVYDCSGPWGIPHLKAMWSRDSRRCAVNGSWSAAMSRNTTGGR